MTCTYCRSQVFPAPSQLAAARSADATERTASELALKRLRAEAKRADELLSQEASVNYAARFATANEQTSKLLVAREGRERTAQKRLDRAIVVRNGVGKLALLFPLLVWILDNMWSFGQWTRGWIALAVGLALLAATQAVVLTLREKHRGLLSIPPTNIPLPPREPTETELRLVVQRDRIDAEMRSHLQIVAKSSSKD